MYITVRDLLINDGFDIDVVNKMKPEEVIKADSIKNWYEKEIYMTKITEKYGGTMYRDPKSITLYNFLKKHFDIVVYVIENKFHIRCSNAFWKDVLQVFLVNRVFCYSDFTEYSLPCIIVLHALQQRSCFEQQFKVDSVLYKEISKYPYVKWADVPDKNYKMLQHNSKNMSLVFRSYNYRQVIEGKRIKESLIFCVDDNSTFQNVFEKEFEFDEAFFPNIINSPNLPNFEQFRNQELLNLAAEMMLPLT